MNKYIETLELHKILEMLANEASNERTKQLALETEPCSDYKTVRHEIQKTSQALELSIKFGSPTFIKFKDLRGSLKRTKSGARISLRELLDIAQMLRQINMLSDWYKHCSGSETELDYLFSRLAPNKYLLERLEMSILSEEQIADSASPELASIRRKITQAGIKLRSSIDKMIHSQSVQKCLQESIITLRDGRYVLPVKAEHKGAVPGLVHDTSSSGQTLFVEPMSIVEANNDIRILQSREQEEIDRIIEQLCADCAAYSDEIIENYEVCAMLNLYFSKSALAARMRAFAPEISDDGIIILNKARHPLIDPKKVVPINVSIGADYQALIITGPNTGGKTVALKTVGLLTVMVMCGLLIPVSDGSKVSVFKNILVDIGDNQSIEQNLSTFSAHTNRVIDIIKTADRESLVLLDELGSGTDPVEGAALAVSVIEKLKSKKARLMVTTHYQELKIYAIETENVENASCEFDIETLSPTYKLIIGSPGKSNAFAISSGLGMPDDVIEYAKGLVSSENIRLENVIEKLEAARKELEQQNDEIHHLRTELRENSEKLNQELSQLDKRKEAEMDRARDMAMSIIERTKAESNELLTELERLRKEKDKESFAKQVAEMKSGSKRVLNRLYDEANPVQGNKNEGYVLPRKLKSGDTVLVVDIDKKGIVAGEPDDSGTVYVQIGIMKTKVSVDKLRLVETEKVTFQGKKIGTKGVQSNLSRRVQQELDIRGRAADEGVYELDMFLNNAVMSGISIVTVIHGKGTGILRKAIHRRLKELSIVKSFRLGVYGEGEDGVTVVELKD